ncbi:MAG: hypothetical protein IJ257_00780 [Treponema sp.]|nr:hypothetical protein [Treponema sp.]
MKKILALVFFTVTSRLFSAAFFSGETGAAAQFVNKDSRGFEPAVFIDGFFTGQFNLSNMLSVRSEFSLRTPDMYDNGFTKDAAATFRINELSATLTRSFLGATHSLSFFLGHFEAPGSQQYIKRHLGVRNYSSHILENYLGQNGSLIYPLTGIGGSYSLTFKAHPVSTGLTISKDNSNFEDNPQINIDWHFATVSKLLTMDFLAGIGAPLYTKNSNDEDVYLLIDTLYFHMGLDLLFGNLYSVFSLYNRLGFEYMPIKSTSKSKTLEISDIYLFVEPRFNFGSLKIHISAYSIPEARLEKLMFIDDTLGVDISIFSDDKSIGKRNYCIGCDLGMSFEGKFFNSLEDKDLMEKSNVKVMPFAEFQAGGGKLKTALQIGITKVVDNRADAVKLHFGYKKDL